MLPEIKRYGDLLEPKFHFESGILCDKKLLKKLHLLIVDDQISSGKTFDLLKNRYLNIVIEIEINIRILKLKTKNNIQI